MRFMIGEQRRVFEFYGLLAVPSGAQCTEHRKESSHRWLVLTNAAPTIQAGSESRSNRASRPHRVAFPAGGKATKKEDNAHKGRQRSGWLHWRASGTSGTLRAVAVSAMTNACRILSHSHPHSRQGRESSIMCMRIMQKTPHDVEMSA
jgi:hypothetical protein